MNLCIIQARLSSKRLPGKVLRQLINKPMLLQLYNRIRNSNYVDKFVIATSIDEDDKNIINLCKNNKIEYYAGDLKNVLMRFFNIYNIYKPKNIIRITGDCPLLHFSLIDEVFKIHQDNRNDYTSNRGKINYVDGFDIEIFKSNLLVDAYKNAKSDFDKEHVTPYIINNINNIRKEFLDFKYNLSKYKLSVDELKDFNLIEKIFSNFKNNLESFDINDINNYLTNNH